MDIGDVMISPSDPGPNNESIGQPFTLECYATINPYPLPKSVPSPRFEWFHGLSMEPLSDDFSMSISSTSTMLGDGNTWTAISDLGLDSLSRTRFSDLGLDFRREPRFQTSNSIL